MRFTVDALRGLKILERLSDDQLAWFAEHGDRIVLAGGEHMFEHGQPADFMFIVVCGVIEGYERVGGQLLRVATTHAGEVTGMLPYSRMTHYPRYTVAVEDAEVLRVRKADFPQMLAASPEMGQRLVAEMSERVRGDVRLEQQQEKMAALGRLSAGLAHELNNPAAAVRRAAASMTEELEALAGVVSGLARHRLDDAHLAAIGELRRRAGAGAEPASPLERSAREDELGTWLENEGVPRAWDLAGTLADAGVTVADLEAFGRVVPAQVRSDALAWVACDLSVRRIAGEIGSAAGRISELVASVKVYSHMDRSPEHKPTDVREGIDNTLTLLRHKVNRKRVRLERDYHDGVSRVLGNAGQLNQVWTNLVDNAIDAVGEEGEVRVEVNGDSEHVDVRIVDDGPGIPEDLRARIFEPFFTTKSVGEGTGLGLDIADRIVRTHQGQLTVESRPGRTVFHVRLPAEPR